MAERVIRSNDSEVWLGWPTVDSGDAYVQLGVLHGDESAWAQLDEDGIDRLRRQLQRAKRRVYGRTDDATGGRVDIDVQLQGGATVTADALTAALASMRACRAQHGQIERPQL